MKVTAEQVPGAAVSASKSKILVRRDRRSNGLAPLFIAYIKRRPVGELQMRAGTGQVHYIAVDAEFRRKGVATALYEAAARWAWADGETPLRSDTKRSPEAEEFWRKQVAKGRAFFDARNNLYESTTAGTTPDFSGIVSGSKIFRSRR